MTARGSTSKKRSDASCGSTQPPDPPVFFVDRCLGAHVVPTAIRSAGYAVELHSTHFEQDAPDDVWIPEVGRRHWIILTKDRHIRSNRIEIEALMAAGTPSFTLMSADTTGPQNALSIVAALPVMLRFISKSPAPFVAGITRAGSVNMLLTFSGMIKNVP